LHGNHRSAVDSLALSIHIWEILSEGVLFGNPRSGCLFGVGLVVNNDINASAFHDWIRKEDVERVSNSGVLFSGNESQVLIKDVGHSINVYSLDVKKDIIQIVNL